MKLLVTAGPTCEDFDPVRFITNRSTGRMGYAVAASAARRGHDVTLVSGPTHLETPAAVKRVDVRSAAEMLDACLRIFPQCDAAVLAAAVADYRPAQYSADKIKKRDNLVLQLERTADIAERLAQERRDDQIVFGFALESDADREKAAGKLECKRFDGIVLNTPKSFGSDEIVAEVLLRGGSWDTWGGLPKRELAERLVALIEARVGG
jgi:phosphopantothenoylcysteine decarboxylase/phosphopantothenate--cysteine ligase